MRNDVKTVFKKICNESSVVLSGPVKGFLTYIGEGTADMLEDFPDIWSSNKKACYLLYLMASNDSVVRPALQFANIGWPKNINPILKNVLEHNKKKPNPITYDMKDRYDFLKLCRHIVKHWKDYCKAVPYLQVRVNVIYLLCFPYVHYSLSINSFMSALLNCTLVNL